MRLSMGSSWAGGGRSFACRCCALLFAVAPRWAKSDGFFGGSNRYGEAETPSESAVNILLELTQKAASGAGVVHMDDWAIRVRRLPACTSRACD